MNSFSYKNRDEIIQNLQKEPYDVIIIGGGITGAGIALDATTRGLKTALVEKDDFASGTSSKSTKLIHGGLRYLKQFHFKMISDVGRERRIVHKLAPHLVLPEKMLLPIMKNSSMGMFSISLGLKLYDILAGVKGDDRRKMLNKAMTSITEPLLPPDRIVGSGLYAEYRTDDARLTIEILKSAHRYGALCLNYVKATDFHYNNYKISGIQCTDHFTDRVFSIKGKHIINAAGPWVDELRSIDTVLKGKKLFITKGVHLVVPSARLPVQHAMYFEISDGRMIFLIPRDQITYIGTTDTPYEGDKDNLKVTHEDASYLIHAVKSILPECGLRLEDIESSWAGLRPLIYEEGRSASEISRKDEIFVSTNGLISIAGGKLTGYRKMAKKVVDRIIWDLKRNHGIKSVRCRTHKIPLVSDNFKNYDQVGGYIQEVEGELKKYNIKEAYAPYLIHNYGKQTENILNTLRHLTEKDPGLRLLKSELFFCLDHEMVFKPIDFLERRTGRLYFWIRTVEQYYEEVLKVFQERFSWNSDQYAFEKLLIQNLLKDSKNFN